MLPPAKFLSLAPFEDLSFCTINERMTFFSSYCCLPRLFPFYSFLHVCIKDSQILDIKILILRRIFMKTDDDLKREVKTLQKEHISQILHFVRVIWHFENLPQERKYPQSGLNLKNYYSCTFMVFFYSCK